MTVTEKPPTTRFVIQYADIDLLHLATPDLTGDSLMLQAANPTHIGHLKITDAHGALGPSGIVYTAVITIDLIEMVGGEITQAENAVFQCKMGKVRVRDLVVHSPATGLRRFLHPRSTAVDVQMSNVLFTLAGNTGPLVNGPDPVDGLIHLSNVRHRSVGVINFNVANLPAGRIVQENVAPLIA